MEKRDVACVLHNMVPQILNAEEHFRYGAGDQHDGFQNRGLADIVLADDHVELAQVLEFDMLKAPKAANRQTFEMRRIRHELVADVGGWSADGKKGRQTGGGIVKMPR